MMGACKEVCQKQAETLIPISHLRQAQEVCNCTRNAKSRKSTNILEYTLARLGGGIESAEHSRLPNGNVSALIKVLFKEFPSRVTTWECAAGHVKTTNDVLITPNYEYEYLLGNGIEKLQDSLEFRMVPENIKCPEDFPLSDLPRHHFCKS